MLLFDTLMSPNANLYLIILSRFNLRLWNKDKAGEVVRSQEWLEHRFTLFERYCLPSIKAQTCQDFKWLVLFDSTTPERFKDKIVDFQKECPQLAPVYVEPSQGRRFAEIFRNEVIRLTHKETDGKVRVLTTYLDNDDALNVRFVEDLQQRASAASDGTFFFYTDGYQYFTDHKYLMKIHYPRNHFVSVVESGNPASLKTIYGFGSHYYISKNKEATIEYVKNEPMWCEVIHERNMGNDAYFIGAKMVNDEAALEREFGINETVRYSAGLYLFRFLPRYLKTFIRRCGYFLFGRHW